MSDRMNRSSLPESKKQWIILWILLALTAAVRIFFSVYPKQATTYYDELLYLQTAQNLFSGAGFSVYGTALYFSKILYSVVLTPFFLIRDAASRVVCISVFNALLVSSSLIPAFLLARKYVRKSWQLAAALLLLALDPCGCFSMTFMAENLFLPLCLWTLYFAVRVLQERKPSLSALTGFLCLLLYLTKETGIALFGALLFALLLSLRSRESRTGALRCMLLIAASFALPWLLLRLTLFGGLPYSYGNQVSLSFLSSSSRLLFLLFSFVYLLLYFLVSCLIFPVVLPTVRYSSSSDDEKTLLKLVLPWALFLLLGIAFGVCLPEDYADWSPKVHLRYMIPVLYPFLLLFLAGTESRPDKKTVFALLFPAALCPLLLRLPFFSALINAPSLQLLWDLAEEAPGTVIWLWIVPAAVVILGLVIWRLAGRKGLLLFFLPVFAALCVCNNIHFVSLFREESSVSDQYREEITKVEALLDTVDGNILVIQEFPASPKARLLDTWTDEDYYVATFDTLTELVSREEGRLAVPLADTVFPNLLSGLASDASAGPDHLDYIVLCEESSALSPHYAEDITPPGVTLFRVYRSLQPELLPLPDPTAYIPGTPILFHGEAADYRNYPVTGFSDCEGNYTWTSGYESTVTLSPVNYAGGDMYMDWSWIMTYNSQVFEIWADDVLLIREGYTGSGEFFEVIPESVLEDGTVTLRFVFPMADTPGEADPRILAFAFTELTLYSDDNW